MYRTCGFCNGKLGGDVYLDYAEAMARPLPEAFDPVPARLEPGLPRVVPEFQAKQALAAWLPPAAERLVHSAEAAAVHQVHPSTFAAGQQLSRTGN